MNSKQKGNQFERHGSDPSEGTLAGMFYVPFYGVCLA